MTLFARYTLSILGFATGVKKSVASLNVLILFVQSCLLVVILKCAQAVKCLYSNLFTETIHQLVTRGMFVSPL